MSGINTELCVGTEIPSLTLPAISRTTLALFGGASGDHNPIHIDSDFAKDAGLEDVFAHGMLSMAYLGRLLTNWQPQAKLRKFSNRFIAITHLEDVITCRGKIIEVFEFKNEQCVKLAIIAEKADRTKTLVGEAIIAL